MKFYNMEENVWEVTSSCRYHGNNFFPVEKLKKDKYCMNNSFIAILQ